MVGAILLLRFFPFVPWVFLALVGVWGVAFAFWLFLVAFFRDPERAIGADIVSAADGRVREVREVGSELLISVFMNVSDVHVNRVPLAGTFASVRETGSGKRPAYRPDADQNVARIYVFTTALGAVRLVQITGILARRLVSFVGVGASLEKGDRFGMIVLGSRVDVFLPASQVEATVRVGDRVHAGSTTIARERT